MFFLNQTNQIFKVYQETQARLVKVGNNGAWASPTAIVEQKRPFAWAASY